MHGLMTRNDDRGILRWGGLAGVVGGLLFLLVFVIVGAFVPGEAADPATAVRFFPDVATVRIVENGLYLVVMVLWMASFVAVGVGSRASAAGSRIGATLGVAGLVVLVVGALPHVAIAPLSALYHADGATTADQATIAVAWQAIQGMLDASLVAGLATVSAGVAVLGVAMAGAAAYGRRVGGFAVVVGAIALGASVVAILDPGSPAPAAGMVALIAFHVVAGWRSVVVTRGGRALEAQALADDPAAAPRVALGRAG